MDSNHRPLPCQGSALDQLSYGPTCKQRWFNSNGDYGKRRGAAWELTCLHASMTSASNRHPWRHYQVVARAGVFPTARRSSSRALRRLHILSNSGLGPFHNRSSIDSNTGTSSLSVARVRKSSASSQAAKRDSASRVARRIEGSQLRASFGMSSKWG